MQDRRPPTIPDVPVLLVEDNVVDATLMINLAGTLRLADYGVEHVKDLAGAIEILSQKEFKLVVLDLNLPDSSGLGTLKELKRNCCEVPIVVITAEDEGEFGPLSLRYGAEDYILKSELSSSVLERSLRYSLERWRLQHELENSKTELLALIFHEIKGPLSVIRRAFELIGDDLDLDEATKKSLLNKVEHAIQRLERNSDRILLLSQLRRQKLQTSTKFQAEDFVKDLVAGQESSVSSGGAVEIRSKVENGIIEGPRVLLDKAFAYVLENAVYFSPPEGVVDITGIKRGNVYIFRIQDRGKGMSEEQLRHILEIGTVDSLINHHEGLGISLCISRAILAHQGGELRIESKPGWGTLVELELPLR